MPCVILYVGHGEARGALYRQGLLPDIFEAKNSNSPFSKYDANDTRGSLTALPVLMKVAEILKSSKYFLYALMFCKSPTKDFFICFKNTYLSMGVGETITEIGSPNQMESTENMLSTRRSIYSTT